MFRYFLFALLLLSFFIWMKNLLINDISIYIQYNRVPFKSILFYGTTTSIIFRNCTIKRVSSNEFLKLSFHIYRARHETFWNSMHATFFFFNKLENSLGTDTIRLMYKEKSKIRFRKKKNLVKKICVKCS